MMKTIMGVGFASLLALALTVPALAQGLPDGSYRASCQDAHMRGSTLTALCQRVDGTTARTELHRAQSCVGDISNQDGRLTCLAPTGSFAETCRDIRVEGNRLYARCERENGTWVHTSTVYRNGHPLSNCDGTLVDSPICDNGPHRQPTSRPVPFPPRHPNQDYTRPTSDDLPDILREGVNSILDNILPRP